MCHWSMPACSIEARRNKISYSGNFLIDSCAGIHLLMRFLAVPRIGTEESGTRIMTTLWNKMYVVKGTQLICVRLSHVLEGKLL